MAGRYSWVRGPLDWDTRARSSIGVLGAKVIRDRLVKEGWSVSQVADADLVARDPHSGHEIRIEVKTLPTSGERTRLLVGDPGAPVDAHAFIASDDRYWVVPTSTLRAKGRAGVLQAADVPNLRDSLAVLKTIG
ncbi:MAG TPA: hypothetical protein VFS37_12230 [Conexibacter sp.]|nr:hypothetical protein [Conexibacter sp.]